MNGSSPYRKQPGCSHLPPGFQSSRSLHLWMIVPKSSSLAGNIIPKPAALGRKQFHAKYDRKLFPTKQPCHKVSPRYLIKMSNPGCRLSREKFICHSCNTKSLGGYNRQGGKHFPIQGWGHPRQSIIFRRKKRYHKNSLCKRKTGFFTKE